MDTKLPILYSFRRCPYAIRARMAIAVSQQQVEHREVDLKLKTEELIKVSPKATVPVLHLVNDTIVDESLDIMHWALNINDPHNWLVTPDDGLSNNLVSINDNAFKQHLDHYKYADRFPHYSMEYYRREACEFPDSLNDLLANRRFLLSEQPTWVDIAIFPFIRQFAFVDKNWFDSKSWPALQSWLGHFLGNELFQSVMKKHKTWEPGDETVIFPG